MKSREDILKELILEKIYNSQSELPDSVKKLPDKAQKIFMKAFNAALRQYGEEERAFKVGWGAVKNAGYGKDDTDTKKSMPEPDTETKFEITKADEDNNLVFGWGSVAIKKDGASVVDHEKDMIEPEDLEDAVYKFMEDFRESGVLHIGESVGHVVESFIVTPEKLEKMGLAPDALPLGWWIGVRVENDEVFAKVKDGTFKMFSIQGSAVKEEVNEDE